MKKSKKFYNIHGFSMVEMAVVMLIVAVLAAGTFMGKELISASKMKKMLSEVDKIQANVAAFRAKYGSLPGDFRNAASRLGCNNCNGNGDGRIGWGPDFAQSAGGNEGFRIWQHLSLAHMTTDSYPGGATTANIHSDDIQAINAVPGQNLPASGAFGNGEGYYIDYQPTFLPFSTIVASVGRSATFHSSVVPTLGQFLYLGRPVSGTADTAYPPFGPGLHTVDAHLVDTKIDDDRPMTGNIRAYNSGACLNPSTNQYNTEEDGLSFFIFEGTPGGCGLAFALKVGE